jgi:hypothetical protein
MSLQKGVVSTMKYFKITRSWAVKAETEDEALRLIAEKPTEYLDSETVTRTEYKSKQPTKAGWGQAVKNQVFGQQGNRTR